MFVGGYKEFAGLKKRNPQLKTLLSIGGWNEGSEKYSNMVRSEGTRRAFINSAISYCQTYGFDGIDFDWEYPCQRGGRPNDKVKKKFYSECFIILLIFREIFQSSYKKSMQSLISMGIY